MSELDVIFATLGQQKTRALLRQITPQIASRSQNLLASLNVDDWKGAAQIAHKMLTTASLMASEPLVKSLMAIEQEDIPTLQQADFKRKLAQQLHSSLKYLEKLKTDQ